ncbi:MAG: thymidine phosphorylase [Candidatus Marinimicrobia bacterium CG08_land_8_20_14_0_20_45_22]|nr:MAG: thymidine phosphorylase [Candidatus Marinimicrobia bacterium CG08_land_8_20_14_0_20_45_22]
MIPTDFIEKKKNGLEHTPEEIDDFIRGYVKGTVQDYQMAAWLMAVNFIGMTDAETITLVDTMLHSGKVIDLSDVTEFKVDKHSTGGVGDKVSLILAPLAVSVGCVVPMISGRSLGHSGGTLDKLESIPGFNVNLSRAEFQNLVKKNRLAMGGQTPDLVPADRKMYSLRDVTSTVKSIPLICGSIMSKKIAEGIDGLVLDVKTGNGAFLANYEDTQRLARQLKNVGEYFGLKVVTLLTDMNQPLGKNVGNWLEVLECIDVLKGGGPVDLVELTLILTGWMMILSGLETDLTNAKTTLRRAIDSGSAYEKFLMMVSAQGGDVSLIEKPEKYQKAKHTAPVLSEKSGYIAHIETTSIGMISLGLGAGRKTLTDVIQPEVGLVIEKKLGDFVSVGEPLAIVYATNENAFKHAESAIREAYGFSEIPIAPPPLVYETL